MGVQPVQGSDLTPAGPEVARPTLPEVSETPRMGFKFTQPKVTQDRDETGRFGLLQTQQGRSAHFGDDPLAPR